MAKGFDPSRNDHSKKVIDAFLELYIKKTHISIPQAQLEIKRWLSDSSYIPIYRQLQQLNQKIQIKLKKACGSNLLSYITKFPDKHDQNFPAYQQNNTIVICLNHIHNKIELKQNLDRELHFKYQQIKNQTNTLDSIATQKNYIKALYNGCLHGYRNYGLDEKLQKRISKKCAQYLYWRRSQYKLPLDKLYRFGNKVIQEI